MLENGKNGVWGKFKSAWPYYAMRQEPGLGAGQPDVVVQDRLGRPGFVELKRPDNVELNPNQWIWHEIWHAGRGKTCIVTCESYGKNIGWHVFVPVCHPERSLQELTHDPIGNAKMCQVVATVLGLKI